MALVERPDLVILTHLLPQLSGVDVTKSIKATHPRMPVMFYCRCAHESLVREAIAAGACSYVLKSNPGRMVVEAVGEVLAGKPYFCPGVIEAAMLSGRRGDSVLTPRQRSIMRLISDGQSNKQVARSLSISIKTVESHRAQLMRRLDLTSIAGLVRYAVRNGISEL
jgi:DNA-binding NarL/FixJ family response regulator